MLFPFAEPPGGDAGGGEGEAGAPDAGEEDAETPGPDAGGALDAGPEEECDPPLLRDGPAPCVPDHDGPASVGGARPPPPEPWVILDAGESITEDGYAGTIHRVTTGGHSFHGDQPFNADSTRFVILDVDGAVRLISLDDGEPLTFVQRFALSGSYQYAGLRWSRVDTGLAWALEVGAQRQSIVGFEPELGGAGEQARKVVTDLDGVDGSEGEITELEVGGESLDPACQREGTAMVAVPGDQLATLDLGGPDDHLEGQLRALGGKALLDLSGRWVVVDHGDMRDVYDLRSGDVTHPEILSPDAVAPGWGVFYEARAGTLVTWAPGDRAVEPTFVHGFDPSMNVSLSAPGSDAGWFLASFCGTAESPTEFQGELVAFAASGEWFVRLGHHQSDCAVDANALARGRAAVSQDGRFALFTREVNDETDAPPLDLYLVSFPTSCNTD